MERAIAGALADAGIAADDVDVVVVGRLGAARVRRARSSRRSSACSARTSCVVAPKSLLGETLGAGGAMGMPRRIAYLRDGVASPRCAAPLRSEVRTVARHVDGLLRQRVGGRHAAASR